ncbi:PAS domain-containing sensor histidine kinase [Muricoccus pecuniae]|uniref:histidine kinase n=1 Tax=Muricoccus pecuniae TaxID=693023 RepID=A0A840YMG7_9PROT|nr:PAS domain S-box protein [Roseomonas pecuniae]MBB5695834.1 PAS domain S-box-containing protein [Roseomonas pecuniae]
MNETGPDTTDEVQDRRYRAIFECAVDFAIIATDRDGRVMDWNPGAERVLGWSAEEVRGRPADFFFTPEDQEEGRPQVEMQRALHAGRADNERWHTREDGCRFWASGEMMPLRDKDGTHLGFLKILRDRTPQQRARERQAALGALMARMRDLDDPYGIMLVAAEALGRTLGVHRVGFFDVTDDYTLSFTVGWADGTLPLIVGTWPATRIGTAYLAEVRKGAVIAIADTTRHPLTTDSAFAEIGTRALVGFPVIRDGRWVAALYVNHAEPRAWSPEEVAFVEAVGGQAWDMVQWAGARAELRASEARWRGIFEYMHEGFALCEMVYGPDGTAADFRYAEVNQAWERLTGVPSDETLGRLASEIFPGIERFWTDTYAQVVETGEPVHFECQVASIGRWFEVYAYRTEPGRFAALFLNVSERKAAEERQTLLAREVDHRAKNALAVVQAALRLTKAPDVASYRTAIEGRIGALARAQSVLAQDRWAGADLRRMLEGELAPFLGAVAGPEARVQLTGPRVAISTRAAQPLTMAVHELATNAVKYGALSVGAGRLSVSWRLESASGGLPLLRLHWVEAGGPRINAQPQRRGFGSRMLDGTVRGQLGGKVRLRWEASGLVCEIEIPLQAGSGLTDTPGFSAAD